MRKIGILTATALAASTLLVAAPASAQVDYVDCGGGACFPGADPVNINSASTGEVNGADIFFTSNEALTYQGSGQASLGAMDGLINNLTFTVEEGYGFTLAEFNLLNQAAGATLTITTVDGISDTFNIDGNGANRFGIYTSGFGLLSSATLNSVEGFGTFTQLRLDVSALQESPVPEPATWAMMLIGFGATGIAMRRSRRKRALLTQLA